MSWQRHVRRDDMSMTTNGYLKLAVWEERLRLNL